MTDLTPAYIGRVNGCGCTVAATVADPNADVGHQATILREVAKWQRSGLVIERTTVEAARAAIRRCPHTTTPTRKRRRQPQTALPGLETPEVSA
jgi:hypothetical protein